MICYKLKGRLWRTSHGYYMLYLYVRDLPPELRQVLERLVGSEIDVAVLCP